MISKNPREIDKEYLAFLQTKECAICHSLWGNVAHHTISRGAFGSDFWAIPLCQEHHYQAHLWDRSKLVKKLPGGFMACNLEEYPELMSVIIQNLISYIKYLKNEEKKDLL